MKYNLLFFSLFVLAILTAQAQDPTRFQEQVDKLYNAEYDFSSDKKLVVFTGSSSIVMWKDVQERFPEYNIINNGFGGSHFSDLLYYYDKLVTKQTPDILFVYEGDNDVAHDKKTLVIYKDFKTLVKKLKRDLPSTKVVFISPKPSVARWHLTKQYNKINKKIRRFCKKNESYEFADVWPIMMDENGMVRKDIFLKDDLHMNKKGYDLWEKVISEFLK
ncbi:MAG: D-alanyl-lipoteichoic acid biosynthesis protein DltD [Draconibacterium sp.]|nr:D-alanyl-lipoteichoic acid biosynthesis protein DltD [Draconibacterium sp.]